MTDALALKPSKLALGGQQALRTPFARPARRLASRELVLLVERYEAGATVYELAGEFGIHRATVGKLLRRQGVRLRLDGMTDAQCQEAAQLYSEGWSTGRIGARFGIAPSTVWRALTKRGVRLRDTQGRER